MDRSDLLRVVVAGIAGVVALACVAGGVYLESTGRTTPAFIANLACTALGALTAALGPLSAARRASSPAKKDKT